MMRRLRAVLFPVLMLLGSTASADILVGQTFSPTTLGVTASGSYTVNLTYSGGLHLN